MDFCSHSSVAYVPPQIGSREMESRIKRAFYHCENSPTSYDSICMKCFRTVSRQRQKKKTLRSTKLATIASLKDWRISPHLSNLLSASNQPRFQTLPTLSLILPRLSAGIGNCRRQARLHSLRLFCLFPCNARASLQRKCPLCRPWVPRRARTCDTQSHRPCSCLHPSAPNSTFTGEDRNKT
jgi:hypothetical protein